MPPAGLLQVSPQTPVPSHISGEEQEQEQQQQAGAASGGRCEVMIQTGISLRNMTYMNSPAQGAAAGQQQQQARSQSQGQAPSDEQRRRSMRSAGNQAQQHEQHVARPAAAAGASQSGSAGAAASKSSAGSAGSTGAARSGAAGAAVAAVASADLDQPGFNRTTNTPASAELADEAAAGPSGHQQQTEQQHSDGAAAAAAAMHYDDDDGGDFGGGDDGWHHDDDDDDEEQQHGDHQQPAAHAASEQRRSGGAAAEHVDEEEEEDEGGNENDAAAANQGGRRGGKRPRMSEVNMREKNAYKKRKSLAGEARPGSSLGNAPCSLLASSVLHATACLWKWLCGEGSGVQVRSLRCGAQLTMSVHAPWRMARQPQLSTTTWCSPLMRCAPAGEGMVTDDGVRRSRRTRYRPLEYWRNEKKNYNRKFKCRWPLAAGACMQCLDWTGLDWTRYPDAERMQRLLALACVCLLPAAERHDNAPCWALARTRQGSCCEAVHLSNHCEPQVILQHQLPWLTPQSALPAALPTVEGVVTRTPVPMWPMTAGNRAKTKRRRQGRESEER